MGNKGCYVINMNHALAKGGLTHNHTMLHFDELNIYSCAKHCEKGEIACNKQFLLFTQPLLLCMALIFHFECTLKCCLQFVSIWTSLNFCHLAICL